MPRIDQMYAFVSEEGPDDEGVVAMLRGGTWIPMVGADMERVDSLRREAEKIAKATGKTIRLVVFSNRKELDIIE